MTLSPLVDGWLQLWNGDLARAHDVVTPDFHVHAALMDGGDGSAVTGPDALAAWIGQTRAAFNDFAFAVEVGPIEQNDLIALRWKAQGTYAGGFPGAAAEPGTPIAFTGTDTLRVVDGRIAEYWVNSDIHVLLAQLKA